MRGEALLILAASFTRLDLETLLKENKLLTTWSTKRNRPTIFFFVEKKGSYWIKKKIIGRAVRAPFGVDQLASTALNITWKLCVYMSYSRAEDSTRSLVSRNPLTHRVFNLISSGPNEMNQGKEQKVMWQYWWMRSVPSCGITGTGISWHMTQSTMHSTYFIFHLSTTEEKYI